MSAVRKQKIFEKTESLDNQRYYSTFSEQACLGALLRNARWLDDISFPLSEEHFSAESHRPIFRIIKRLVANREAVDIVTVSSALERSGELSDSLNADYIIQLMEAVPVTFNFPYYAEILLERAQARGVKEILFTTAEELEESPAPASEVLESLAKRILSLEHSTRKQTVIDAKALAEQTIAAMEQYQLAASTNGHVGLQTGLTEFDKLTGGLKDGNLIILGARPSVGKTALAITWALSACRQQKPVLFFTMEMSANEIAMRMISQTQSISLWHILNGKLDGQQSTRAMKGIRELSEYRLMLDDRSDLTEYDVCTTARQVRRNYGDLRLIVVDYLQLMNAKSKRGDDNRNLELGVITRSLKKLARELNCPIVLLAQLNREVEKRAGGKPNLADLRDSGNIEQDADLVVLLARDKEMSPSLVEIIVAKARNGSTGTVNCAFAPSYARLQNGE